MPDHRGLPNQHLKLTAQLGLAAMVTLFLAGYLAACKNFLAFDPCAVRLTVDPKLDSVAVGAAVTFNATAQGGCAGLTTGPGIRAIWVSRDTTIARLVPPASGPSVVAIALRPGRVAIVVTAAGAEGSGILQVR